MAKTLAMLGEVNQGVINLADQKILAIVQAGDWLCHCLSTTMLSTRTADLTAALRKSWIINFTGSMNVNYEY